MKKILLLAGIAFAGLSNAQSSFAVTELASGNASQWHYSFTTDTNDINSPTFLLEFKIHNTSASSKIIKIRKSVLAMATNTVTAMNHDMYFCYNQTCFGPSQNYWFATVAAGASLPNGTNSYGLRTEMDQNKVIGTSVVRYTVYDSTNTGDSTNITITYNVTAPNAIKSVVNTVANIHAYPNPAANVINFNYEVTGSALIKIYSSVGSLVKTIPIQQGTKSVQADVSMLEEGFYFYSVIADGKAVSTRRLVITR